MGSVDRATLYLRVRPRARIAMLAVVQMVYPTIKSDARLLRKIPCFREIQTRRTSNARAGPRGTRAPRERNESRELDDPHPSSGLFSCSPYFPCIPPGESHYYRLVPSFVNPLAPTLSRFLRTIPFAHSSSSARPPPGRRVSRVAEGRNVFVFGLSPDNLRQ